MYYNMGSRQFCPVSLVPRQFGPDQFGPAHFGPGSVWSHDSLVLRQFGPDHFGPITFFQKNAATTTTNLC